MILSKLQQLIGEFKTNLSNPKIYQGAFKWEALNYFQKNWDINAADFRSMYDQSLHSRMSRQLWTATSWSPKQKMLDFIDMESDYVRMMFRDLFDESKAPEARADRFLYYCDELMNLYRSKHPVSIETSHDHEDYRMICLYLAFRFPANYTLYHFEGFRKTLDYVKAKDIPLSHDLSRFFKTSRIVYTFLKKEEGLIDLHRKNLRSDAFYPQETMLLVHDFYEFVHSKPG